MATQIARGGVIGYLSIPSWMLWSAGAMRGKLTTAVGNPPVKHFPGEGLRQRQRTIRPLHASRQEKQPRGTVT
jgi:hypothetical protein